MHPDITTYNLALSPTDSAICKILSEEIDRGLPEAESKIWHSHPVWFLSGNPIVGYAKRKKGIVLLFWSGQSFEEAGLKAEGSFQAAEACYTSPEEIDTTDLTRWLEKSRDIQWDYKNIIKHKGKLERLK